MTPIKSMLIAATGLAIVLPAAAVTTDITKSENFTYDRAELDTKEGVERVYAALEDVAESVCAPEYATRSLFHIRLNNACETNAMDQAVARIDHPALTARHTAKSKR